ncbi:helix-turn-helix domain-containing protein [Azotobacter chroococcum]|uniref:helix-turn-helix domain-containing protein n=1 Tax=Azotobacter chroococcum TaxID=353 RepID=UPI0013969D1C
MQSFAEELGLSECVVSIKDGKSVLKGHTLSGQAINVIVRDSGTGFKEQTVSVCDVLTVEARRAEAKRLRKEGLSQTAIGARLGVSQKTISNDLNS